MTDAVDQLINLGLHNQIVSGGLVLGIAGAVLAGGHRLLRRLLDEFGRRLLVRIEVRSTESLAFAAVLAWLDAHPYRRHCRNLMVADDEDDEGAIKLAPGRGIHLLRTAAGWVLLDRHSLDGNDGGFSSSRDPAEAISFTTLGLSNQALSALVTAIVWDRGRQHGYQRIWTASYDHWSAATTVAARRLNSLALPAGEPDAILNDVRAFLVSADWYRTRGVPWRRGYLLSGPPGTGKSSLVGALAGAVGYDLAIVTLSNTGLNDAGLAKLFRSAPTRTFLVLEDIDVLFSDRGANGDGRALTFSGLLNALDGVAAQEGRPVVMTTNHPERLDPALIRPGRIDYRLTLGPATPAQAISLFCLFFPDATPDMAEAFGQAYARRDEPMTPAALQGFLLLHRDDPRPTLAIVCTLAKQSGEPERIETQGD